MRACDGEEVWDKDLGDVRDDFDGHGDVWDDFDAGDVWDDFEADDISSDTSYPPGEDYNEVSAAGCSDKYWSCRYYSYYCWLGWLSALCPATCGQCGSVFTRLDDSMVQLRQQWPTVAAMVSHYHPVFDFTSDSCFPDAAVDRFGKVNDGSGTNSLTVGCRSEVFLKRSKYIPQMDIGNFGLEHVPRAHVRAILREG